MTQSLALPPVSPVSLLMTGQSMLMFSGAHIHIHRSTCCQTQMSSWCRQGRGVCELQTPSVQFLAYLKRKHSTLESKLQQDRPKEALHGVSLEEEQVGVSQGKPCLGV